MTKEEDFFKENFPEYVTEKGEFLSPYWDLFSAGVICANFELKVRIEKLEKENAELDCQKNRNKYCYSCANATERCFRNEIGCPCQKYKSYKDEITELKAYNEKLLNGDIEKHNKIVELKEKYDTCLRENTGLKIHSAYVEKKLTEAKEIIKMLHSDCYSIAECEDTNLGLWEDDLAKAEQFLKECE